MPKSEIHPMWFKEVPVFCDGKPICFISSTKKELQVDLWLAKHPFYSDSKVIVDTEGRVERFMKKYQVNSTE